ncbi:MAG: tripartite tricarboxylate transporter TctB family protein [Burkholderiaceae bacterium]
MRMNLVLAGGVSIIGALLLWWGIPEAVTSPSNVRLPILAPTFWPIILAWGLIGIGVMVGIKAVLAPELPEPVESAAAPAVPGSGAVRVVALALLMIVYYLCLAPLGMVLSSTLTGIALTFLVRSSHKVASVFTAVLLPLSIYLFFRHVAGVPIPLGLLEGLI